MYRRLLLVLLACALLGGIGWISWNVLAPAYHWRAVARPLYESRSKPASAWTHDQRDQFWGSLFFLSSRFPGYIQTMLEREFGCAGSAEAEQLMHLVIVLYNLDISRLDWPTYVDHKIPRYEGLRTQTRFILGTWYQSFFDSQATFKMFKSEDLEIRLHLASLCSLKETPQGSHAPLCTYALRDSSPQVRVVAMITITRAPEASQHVECLKRLLDTPDQFMRTAAWGALAAILKDSPSRREFVRRFGEEEGVEEERSLMWLLELNLGVSVVNVPKEPGDPILARQWAISPYHKGRDRERWLRVWQDWASNGELHLEGIDDSK